MAKVIQAVRGMNDILPDQMALWEFFEDSVRDWLRAYGYRPIRTPVLEHTDLFVRSIGEVTDIVEKEMYTFVDALNDESLTLRPEGTASCVRAAIEHNLIYNAPQRLYYTGPMFRHERPQKGRYRQFHQVGIEALGFPGPDVDAEHLIMCQRLWRMLGLQDIKLELNSLGDRATRAAYRARLISYFEQHLAQLDEDAKRRLHTNPLRILDSKNAALRPLIDAAPKMIDQLDAASIAHFEGVQSALRDAGVEFVINPKLVRGLDYYNYTVFEWVSDQLGAQGTVCAGGRYDGLFEQLGGKPAPGCGLAMGVERLLALMQQAQREPLAAVSVDTYVVHQGEQANRMAPLVAERLRDAGIRVTLHCGGGSFKSQMKRADASGARYAVVIGDDEAAQQQVSVKPLRGQGEQVTLSVDQAIGMMR